MESRCNNNKKCDWLFKKTMFFNAYINYLSFGFYIQLLQRLK